MTLRGRSTPTEVWLADGAGAAPAPRPRARLDAAGRPRARAGPAGQRAAPRRCATACRRWSRCSAAPASARAAWCASCSGTPDRLIDQPVTWRTGRCPPFGENVTFAALADIVKAEAGILDTDTAAAAAQRLDVGRRRAGRAGRGRPAHRRAAPAGRPARPPSCRPRRPSRRGGGSWSRWPPAGRPCWSSRTCTGPTRRCCASSSCSARPRGTCRCCCSAPPGPS